MIAVVDVGRVVAGLLTAAAALALARSWWREWRCNRRPVVALPARSHVRKIERPTAEHVLPPSVGRSPDVRAVEPVAATAPALTIIAGGDAIEARLWATRRYIDQHPVFGDRAVRR